MNVPIQNIFKCLFLTLFTLMLQGCISVKLFDEQLQTVTVEKGSGFGRSKIAIIDVSGVLTDSGPGSGFMNSDSSVVSLSKKLDYLKKDSRIKALVLRVNSPGGGVTASDIMYNMLSTFSEEEKIPVYVSMQSVAASGGYYISMAAKEVYATPTSITGSMGVIATFPEVDGLMGKVGLSMNAITSGKNKDTGAFYKKMTAEDRALYQAVVDEMYGQFLDVIAKNRTNLTPEQVKTLADGRIYTAQQAYSEGLIDGVLYLEDVVERVKVNEKLSNAEVILIKQGSASANDTVYASAPTTTNQYNLLNIQMDRWQALGHNEVFSYLWMP